MCLPKKIGYFFILFCLKYKEGEVERGQVGRLGGWEGRG